MAAALALAWLLAADLGGTPQPAEVATGESAPRAAWRAARRAACRCAAGGAPAPRAVATSALQAAIVGSVAQLLTSPSFWNPDAAILVHIQHYCFWKTLLLGACTHRGGPWAFVNEYRHWSQEAKDALNFVCALLLLGPRIPEGF